jgi:CRISPR system Cascade subunit CasA
MMPSFNLLDEKWIPTVMADSEPGELSLREALIEAHRTKELFDNSPLLTAALHRVLLAVLWRVFPLRSLPEWKTLWQAQHFDSARLEAYFDQWRERFDLLHPEKPFYQVGSLTLSKRTPLKRLGWEFAAGNNGTLFDHSSDDDRPAIEPKVVARWIVATQCFAASAGRGESGQLHTKDSPWSRGAAILIQGDNLFETLTLNLLNFLRTDFPQSNDDLPTWESDTDWQPQYDETPGGILEYLTWQSRAIKLLPNDMGQLCECYFAQGRAVHNDFKIEPMYAYKRDQKLGLLVWLFNEDRVLWRDSHALFNLSDDAPFQLPQTLHHLARLVREKTLGRDKLYRLQVLGQSLESGQPTIRFWRNERLPLRPDYLNEKLLLGRLRSGVMLSEKVAKVLQSGVYSLAKALLEFITNRQPDTKDIKQMTTHLQTETFYWSQLEAPFKQLLTDLPLDQTQDDEGEIIYGAHALAEWARTLERTAKEAFLIATRSLDTSSRALKAVALAEHRFNTKLREVLSDALYYETDNTVATGGE